MKRLSITTIFWALIGVFVVIIIDMMLIPLTSASSRIYIIPLMFISWAAFFVLGLALIVLAVKRKTEGLLKKFLLLTGISAVGFPVFVVLHNLVSGLLSQLLNREFEEPIFFILAVFICPIGFMVGATGSIIQFIKKRNRS
ncbi:hypothetical protein ACFLYY_02000 [Patescibacteria group bacterium]